jgi:hypothetical protein
MVKEENEKFKSEIQAIHTEMQVLLELLPTKDSASLLQQQQIFHQVVQMEAEFNDTYTSWQRRQQIAKQLSSLRGDVSGLKTHLKKTVPVGELNEDKQDATEIMEASMRKKYAEQRLSQTQKEEIDRLKAQISLLEKKPGRENIDDKLAVYYFNAFSSDRKNRAAKTTSLTVELQLKGNFSKLKNEHLQIEIRDPRNHVITTPHDHIHITTDYVSTLVIEPSGYEFIKGRYSIRLHSKGTDLQSVTFLTLL